MANNQFLFANNAQSTLAGAISSGATSIPLATGTGALFPNPSAGQQFTLTLNDAATGLVYEVCYCTARSGDVLTVTRGQEGTTARAWLAGDFAANMQTAGAAGQFAQSGTGQNVSFGNVAITGSTVPTMGFWTPAANTVAVIGNGSGPNYFQIGNDVTTQDVALFIAGSSLGTNGGGLAYTNTAGHFWAGSSTDDLILFASSANVDVGYSGGAGASVTFFNAGSGGSGGDFKWNSAGTITMALFHDGGLVMGSPTGSDKGAGTINVAGGVYLNGTAFTNPDYVFEHWVTGKTERFADNAKWMGEANYVGPMPIDELASYVRSNLSLPRFGQSAGLDYCRGGEALLATIEEMQLYIFELHDRLKMGGL